MARARVVVGAHVVCYINGKVLGRVVGFSFRSNTENRAVYTVDTPDPQELAPGRTKISGSIKLLKTVADGGAEGAGMATNFEDFVRQKYFTIQLLDRGSFQVIFEARECSLNSQNWEIPVKGVVSGALEFEAITWSNEIKALGDAV